jgi:hypothetical protein
MKARQAARLKRVHTRNCKAGCLTHRAGFARNPGGGKEGRVADDREVSTISFSSETRHDYLSNTVRGLRQLCFGRL